MKIARRRKRKEEEEEEEEEHEGSDMDMEYDYYDDLEESYFGVADRDEDLFIQLEDVFPGMYPKLFFRYAGYLLSRGLSQGYRQKSTSQVLVMEVLCDHNFRNPLH